MNIEEMIERIDIVANAQRFRLVDDPTKAFEYMETEKEALAFRSANYEGSVPVSVQDWSGIRGLIPKEACDDILLEAMMLHMAIALIRRYRLEAKWALKAVATAEEAQVIFEKAINDLKSVGPQ